MPVRVCARVRTGVFARAIERLFLRASDCFIFMHSAVSRNASACRNAADSGVPGLRTDFHVHSRTGARQHWTLTSPAALKTAP
eukprot:6195712-Pleurochrysis_carterae.AAC.2